MHIEEDALEQYAMGELAGNVVADIEEHLLSCQECQSRLVELDRFISAFHAAAAHADARVPERVRTPSFLRPLWAASVLSFAAALILLILGRPGAHQIQPAVVMMQTFRGPAGARIDAGKPARLVFDLGANRPAGLIRYQVQFVDQSGQEMLHLDAAAEGEKLAVPVAKLRAGSYWVRLYREQPGKQLLQEYLLKAE